MDDEPRVLLRPVHELADHAEPRDVVAEVEHDAVAGQASGQRVDLLLDLVDIRVCTENLPTDVAMMKSAEDRM
jgi:hypothetical protein